VLRIDGSPLRYNQADVYLPDLLIGHLDRADDILKKITLLSPIPDRETLAD
jgi:3'(2'), 5'-bisphosphate nucleotidase